MFPRAAPEKPLQINYAARHKFVGAAITGFCALGTAIVYFSDMVRTTLNYFTREPLVVLSIVGVTLKPITS